jgi:hypothetical protein
MPTIFHRSVLATALFGAALAPAFAVTSVPATAPRIVPGSVDMFRDDRGANHVGLTGGDRFQYGAEIVGGSTGVSISGTAATGFHSGTTACVALAVDADFCSQSSACKSSRLQPWQLDFSNAAGTTTVVARSLVGVPLVPFPTSVTLSGHGTTPTISWQVPGGVVPDGFRIQVFDKNQRLSNGQADIIYSANVSASATTFTLPASLHLSATGSYAINFQLIETRGDAPFGAGSTNAAIFSRSNSFFDFSPLTGNVPTDVALPTIDSTGVYHFEVGGVGPDHATCIDPVVATGYQYAIGATGPDFQSVLLPDVGDGDYALTYIDGSGTHTVDVLHDQQYFFGNGGVAAFTVTGIETSAGLDPTNGTAFVTGLTFAGDGDFIGTMTPITAEVAAAVPEPAPIALFLAGLGAFGVVRRRARIAA